MKKLITYPIIIALFSLITAEEQTTITPAQASKHVGKYEKVCGQVASTYYAYKSNGSPTFINLDKPYPDQIFTVMVWGSDRKNFKFKPEDFYRDKEICVEGKIKKYKGVAEIIIKTPKEVTVIDKKPVQTKEIYEDE